MLLSWFCSACAQPAALLCSLSVRLLQRNIRGFANLRHPMTAISSETSFRPRLVLGNMITWRFCYAIATGCRLPNELSRPIDSAHSFISVHMVMHRGTLLITWHWHPPSVEGAACNLWTLSLWKCRELVYRLATELYQSQARVPGTVFPLMFALPSQCTRLENI